MSNGYLAILERVPKAVELSTRTRNERGIKRLVATVNWKISVYSSNIFVLTKEPHQEADTSKLNNIQIIKADELKTVVLKN